MSSDPLQLALEHHRAGRVTQAEAGYRQALAADPGNGEALMWLGVLAFQAGRADEAVPMLARAAESRPGDAAGWHNLGHAYLAVGRASEAIDAFGRAFALAPGRGETLMALGIALLSRREPGDADGAVLHLRQATAAGVRTAEVYHHLGVALVAAGLAGEAIEAFRAALATKSEDPSTYYHLALAHWSRGEVKEVRKNLNKALEVQPRWARAWHALALLDEEAGNLEIAAGLFKRALGARPDYAPAYQGLGRVLEKAGRRGEAMGAFAQAVKASHARRSAAAGAGEAGRLPLDLAVVDLERRLTGEKAVEFHHAMAGVADVFAPSHVPQHLITNLFDKYAGDFDAHLVGQLQYRAPERLAEAVAALRADGDPPLDVLDMGCGTGLCGPLFRPMAGFLCGVDLSAGMIEKARERGSYDRLLVGDVVQVLQQSPVEYDLLVGADSLIYIGDLSPVFDAAATALRPGGRMAFTLEAGGGDRYHLHRKTLRYTHAKPYVRKIAALYGFAEEVFDTIVPRYEGNKPVAGYLIVLKKG